MKTITLPRNNHVAIRSYRTDPNERFVISTSDVCAVSLEGLQEIADEIAKFVKSLQPPKPKRTSKPKKGTEEE